MDNILVTAFFDIGRGDVKTYSVPRSTELYFEQFEHWSGIKNQLVCFCDPGVGERIKRIRRDKGLEDKTEVIEIDIKDLRSLTLDNDERILDAMLKIEKDINTQNVHLVENAMSGKAKYSYVMYVKYYCICEAVKRYGEESLYTWIDFGFDKNGMRFKEKDFDRIWIPEVNKDKITFFTLYDPDIVSLLEMLILQTDCMIGDMFIVPGKLAGSLMEWALEAVRALLMLECYDDDQMIMLIVYRKHREFIECYHSTWVAHYAQVAREKINVKPHYRPSLYSRTIMKLRMIKHHQLSDRQRLKKMNMRIKNRLRQLRRLENSFEVETYGRTLLSAKRFEK